MLRIVALALLPLVPGLSWALGLGDITVTSALNEPLRASIQVHSLRPGEADELTVRIADEAAFRRVGLERSNLILSLDIEVVPAESETEASILLSSRQGVREPILGFLLDISGLRNRMLREYTVLLDPQRPTQRTAQATTPVIGVVDETPSRPVRRPSVTPRPPAAAPRPTAAPQPAAQAERSVPIPAPQSYSGTEPAPAAQPVPKPVPGRVEYEDAPAGSDGEGFGPIQAGTTPWRVALAIRPDERVSMDQVLWALYSANPSAFDDNLNVLKEGAILQVPSRQAMINVSPAEASVLVAEEAEAYRQRTGQPRPQQVERVQAEQVRAEPVPTPRPTPRSTPRPTARPATPAPQAALPALPEEPELEPLPEEPELQPLPEEPIAEDDLEPLPVEPAPPEESVRVVEPDEELATLPADDADSSAEFDEDAEALRRLQELAGELDAEPLPAEPAETSALPAADAEDERDFGNLPELPEQAESLPAPAADFDADEGGFNPMVLLLPLLLIGGGIGAFVFLRRRQQDSDGSARSAPGTAPAAVPLTTADQGNEQPVPPPSDSDTQVNEPVIPAAPSKPEPTTDFVETDVDESSAFGETSRFDAPVDQAHMETQVYDSTEEFDAPAAPPEETQEVTDVGDETIDLGSETVSLELNEDPVSEADFHLAYGLYDEAALLLNQAIENDPDRMELREKLAETYFAAGNTDAFLEAAQALKEKSPSDSVWQKVAIMGQQLCPESELFQGELGGDAVDFGFGDDGGDLDMDFDSGDAADSTAETAAETPAEDSNLLEFDLEDDAPAPDSPVADTPTEDDAPLEFAMDEVDESPTEDELTPPAADGSDESVEFSLEDTGFEDLDLDAPDADEEGEDLPDIDAELDLGDLAAELDADDDDTTVLSFDPPAAEPELTVDEPASPPEPATEPEATEEAPELQLSDNDMEQSLDLSEEIPAEDDDDMFGLDKDPLADLDVDNLELESLDMGGDSSADDDFDLDAEATQGGEDFSELTAELPEEGLETLDLGSDDGGAISDGDEAGTKLDLARAYVDMGEGDMARSLLEEVVKDGSDEQKSEAQELLARLS